MWDPLEEKANMYSRVGDFYYGALHEDDRTKVQMLLHLPMQCRILKQAANLQDAICNASYFEDNWKIIRFKDEDVDWMGLKTAFQQQYVGASKKASLQVDDTAIATLDNDTRINNGANTFTAEDKQADLIIPDDTQIMFGLNIDKDIMVTSIRLNNGQIYYANQDFQTEFGRLVFFDNPLSLFPDHKFMAQSYTYRKRSFYCFPLGVDTYGPVDRILHYYKAVQSPQALYLASAQAIGMPVVKQDCYIKSVAPLGHGVTYFTSDGERYDADYPHTHLNVGERLSENQVIAGSQLYNLIGPYDNLPNNLFRVELDYVLPVHGLSVTHNEIQITDEFGMYKPMFDGSDEDREAYWDYLARWQSRRISSMELPSRMSGIKFLREVLCKNRCIIVHLNKNQMLRDMQLKLLSFLRRELPIGSVLTVANLPAIISEANLNNV